jgi:hypothetical protein
LSIIDSHGDPIIQIKKIFPDLEVSEFKKLLSYIKVKENSKSLEKEVEKVSSANIPVIE